jgi:DNA-binding HxlR family transcriptional regulator
MMAVGSLSEQSRPIRIAAEDTVGAVLRLVGTEPAGTVLMTLGQRPLRTKQLTERIPDVSARSVYRCVSKLEERGLVEHRADGGGSTRVLLRLTEPAGRHLVRLLRQFTSDSTAGPRESGGLSWTSLCLLGELWEWGFAAELAHGPRCLVELLNGTEGLTYHQVRRRTGQFADDGLLDNSGHDGNGRHYELADHGRRAMLVIAALGRWRHRHYLADGTPGLELEEVATVLRAILPLVSLPAHAGMRIDFVAGGDEDKYGHRDTAELRGTVTEGGALRVGEVNGEDADGSAAATINTWFAALLDGNRGRIRVRGELGLVDACLTGLYSELWVPLKR